MYLRYVFKDKVESEIWALDKLINQKLKKQNKLFGYKNDKNKQKILLNCIQN